jgi:hypothetical protein
MLRDRDAKTRRTLAVRLAKLIAGVTEGRPRVPPDEVLYHDVRHASEFLQPLYQVLREAAENPTTDRTAWRRFESQNKRLAELVSALGLREKWFAWGTLRSGSASASARRSSRRKDATLLSLAYEFVAARYRMKASTVEKHVQAVNSRRRPRKIRGPKFRVKWTRDNSA